MNFGKLPNGRQTVASVTGRTADAAMWNVELPAPSSNAKANVMRRPPARV